jgi:uncharacterized protein YqgC (DUF456 family)
MDTSPKAPAFLTQKNTVHCNKKMDYLLLLLGLFLIILGIIGAFLPILPGPPTGWLGLLLLQLTDKIPTDWKFLWITLAVAMAITLLDFVIPILGAKSLGGSKKGIWGATIGLFVGLFFGPLGLVFGPLIGAFSGELMHNPTNKKIAFKAAFGSFVGFLFSTGIKFTTCLVFLMYFIENLWQHKDAFF